MPAPHSTEAATKGKRQRVGHSTVQLQLQWLRVITQHAPLKHSMGVRTDTGQTVTAMVRGDW